MTETGTIDTTAPLLFSSYGGDSEMAELVAMFVNEMPDRIEQLQRLLSATNWDELGRLAHQMKGACGSYGFEQMTPLAARLEQATRGGESVEAIRDSLQELSDALSRARAGAPCS